MFKWLKEHRAHMQKVKGLHEKEAVCKRKVAVAKKILEQVENMSRNGSNGYRAPDLSHSKPR